MKRLRKAFSIVLILVCLASITVNAFADADYVVRLFAGDPETGTLKINQNYEGSNRVHYSNSYTPSVDFNVGENYINIVNEKYYAKGIREAGKDYLNVGNDTPTTYVVAQTNGEVNVNVTRDQDYVVVYGISGLQVQFTIRCVDASTGALLRTLTYWGDVGDQPMITLPYIEGYIPPTTQATTPVPLSSDSSQNIWNARYTRITTTTTTTTTTTVVGGGGGGGAAVAGGAAANVNANNANNAANNQNANNQQETTTQADFGGYEDIVDLDVPLAAPDMLGVGTAKIPSAPKVIEANQTARIPQWALIAGAVVLVGLIAMLYWYLLFYRKKKKYASISDDFEILDYDDDEDF